MSHKMCDFRFLSVTFVCVVHLTHLSLSKKEEVSQEGGEVYSYLDLQTEINNTMKQQLHRIKHKVYCSVQ